MDLNEQLDENFTGEDLDLETRAAFLEVAKWSNGLLVIIGSLFLLGTLFVIGVVVLNNEMYSWVFGLIFLLLFCVIPLNYLYQFSRKTKKAIETLDDVLFASALQNLKSFFKFGGILCLLVIAYYVIVIVVLFVGVSAF